MTGLVFLESDPPGDGREEDFVCGVGPFTKGLSNVILVSNAGDASLEA